MLTFYPASLLNSEAALQLLLFYRLEASKQ